MEYIKGQENGAAALPCLNSNISIETTDSTSGIPGEGLGESGRPPSLPRLSTQHRKSAFVLKESVSLLGEKFGIENLGFLTLTFREHITCAKQAQLRLKSLTTNVLKPRYREYLGVMERQKSGRIHYHFLVVLDDDIRTGFDFDALARRDYRSASSALRNEWAFWRSTAPKYRFGRTELLPVKSTMEAMAKYVGKYISKHVEAREEQDKGVRLVRYSQGAKAGTTRFQFHSTGSADWRRKVATFAQIATDYYGEEISSLDDLSRVAGKRWAFYHREFILNLP